ncbi:uncharacterized protein LOC130646000 [Hydractinia symbiolongicarpus]|uniref:uncharacterized protein LOC130646000 n=1 Tax=Hydractinia symbiolongicarpus TaxID=13093 RepID=UPI00254EDB75|nr:uncharacterized protein LOC130646000 [Hydractinia symbiolongicarpus]
MRHYLENFSRCLLHLVPHSLTCLTIVVRKISLKQTGWVEMCLCTSINKEYINTATCYYDYSSSLVNLSFQAINRCLLAPRNIGDCLNFLSKSYVQEPNFKACFQIGLACKKYPPTHPGLVQENFSKWTVAQLQDFLQIGINRSGKKEQLVLNAYSAYNLQLPVVFLDPQEEQAEILNDRSSKLHLEGGLVKLPIPWTLIDGWMKALSYLPNTTQDDIKNNNVMSHNIGNNVRYCFVRDNAKVICGDCSCVASFQCILSDFLILGDFMRFILVLLFFVFSVGGVCKHFGCLLWYIEREVREGRNLTCTSKPQMWHAPTKRQTKLHQPDMINNIEIKKPKMENIFTVNPKYERSSFQERLIIENRSQCHKTIATC